MLAVLRQSRNGIGELLLLTLLQLALKDCDDALSLLYLEVGTLCNILSTQCDNCLCAVKTYSIEGLNLPSLDNVCKLCKWIVATLDVAEYVDVVTGEHLRELDVETTLPIASDT